MITKAINDIVKNIVICISSGAGFEPATFLHILQALFHLSYPLVYFNSRNS